MLFTFPKLAKVHTGQEEPGIRQCTEAVLEKLLLLYKERILPVDIPIAKRWGELSVQAEPAKLRLSDQV